MTGEHRITESEELELRGRVTLLEEWAGAISRAQQALALGVVFALLLAAILARKGLR